MVSPALQGRDPDLVRLEVDVAGADPERLGHPAPGHREGAREGLDAGLGVRAHRGEEALALGGGQVLPPARVDEEAANFGELAAVERAELAAIHAAKMAKQATGYSRPWKDRRAAELRAVAAAAVRSAREAEAAAMADCLAWRRVAAEALRRRRIQAAAARGQRRALRRT